MTKPFNEIRLGIVQGGQLGRMMIQSAVSYDVTTHVLDPSPDAPCAKLCDKFTIGDPLKFDDVYNFGKAVDVLTIEYEHINTDALEKLAKEGIEIYPRPGILRIVQDKGLQKLFYRDHEIPTADFVLVNNRAELTKHVHRFPGVLKLRRDGYDGRGVMKIKNADDIPKAFDRPCVLEEKVDFLKELSVIIARDPAGTTAVYPVVELEFNPQANLVELLFAPADITSAEADKAVKIARKVAEALELVGILAVEMFLTRSGELLVNEIAPRSHNSGHHTIEANATSQFEQQLRVALGLPLGSTAINMPAAMINLLGEPGFEGPVKYEGIENAMRMKRVYVHLYGKKMVKPFRKMGHVTVMDGDTATARRRADIVRQTIRVIA
ncbi:5-(carboxyamino)imidazole ribonucleotide synthase [Candidatus Sumerlaeota bacterium]|nr:5-(carboxyamino)imidazole ribonucleotide synthase [Candidatus Sumerlaeota bacterium]